MPPSIAGAARLHPLLGLCSGSAGLSPATRAPARAATSRRTTTLATTLFDAFLDERMHVLVPRSSTTPGRASRTPSWRSSTGSASDLELGPDDHLLEIGTGWGGLAIHAAADPRLPGDDDDDLARAARLRASSACAPLASTTGSSPAQRLPRPDRRLRQARLDRDDRGGRLAVLPDLLREVRRAAQARRQRVPPGDRDRRRRCTSSRRRRRSFANTHVFPGGCLPSELLIERTRRRQTRCGALCRRHHADSYSTRSPSGAGASRRRGRELQSSATTIASSRLWTSILRSRRRVSRAADPRPADGVREAWIRPARTARTGTRFNHRMEP